MVFAVRGTHVAQPIIVGGSQGVSYFTPSPDFADAVCTSHKLSGATSLLSGDGRHATMMQDSRTVSAGMQPPRAWGSRLNLDRWVPYRSDGLVRCRVFCFPHAGGNATFYRPLRQAMPAGLDFCPIELPGRGARMGEPLITDVDTLLAVLSRTIKPLMNVPFAFFGHSTGASVAYRAARSLCSADGRKAMHLFVSARAAPPGHGARSAQALSDSALRLLLRRFGGTPDIVLARDELITALLPIMRADLVLGESCAADDKPLDCTVTAFGGENDAIGDSSLEAWSRLTRRPFRLRLFAGGHFYLGECRKGLADEIARDLHGDVGLEETRRAEAGQCAR
jgi:medium-chain acyl-[acyl-carrier-protein] hydrolase